MTLLGFADPEGEALPLGDPDSGTTVSFNLKLGLPLLGSILIDEKLGRPLTDGALGEPDGKNEGADGPGVLVGESLIEGMELGGNLPEGDDMLSSVSTPGQKLSSVTAPSPNNVKHTCCTPLKPTYTLCTALLPRPSKSMRTGADPFL